MTVIEIMDQFIINFEFSFQIPANNILEHLVFETTLPEGLTYAKNPGAKIKHDEMLGWMKATMEDYSTDANTSPLFIPSRIHLEFKGSFLKPDDQTYLTLAVPLLVYDAEKLLQPFTNTNITVTLSQKHLYGQPILLVENELPLVFKPARLKLLTSSLQLYNNDITKPQVIDIGIPLLHTLNIDKIEFLDDIYSVFQYVLKVKLPDDVLITEPFRVLSNYPTMYLKPNLDYTIEKSVMANEYTITLNSVDSLNGKTVLIEIPFRFIRKYPDDQLPKIFHCDVELLLLDGIQAKVIANTKGQLSYYILPSLPTVKIISRYSIS
ncbi:MAG TPA: hypothetical protein DCY20_08375 [Firmicutes bacterium]|nr:hypothetical protein [Bacillota bacterium]